MRPRALEPEEEATRLRNRLGNKGRVGKGRRADRAVPLRRRIAVKRLVPIDVQLDAARRNR